LQYQNKITRKKGVTIKSKVDFKWVRSKEISSLEIKIEKRRSYYKEMRHDFGKGKLHVLTCFLFKGK
jgi:hypothetical protein